MCSKSFQTPLHRCFRTLRAQVYGVGKAGFPLKISLRLQEPDVMVFDDLLSLSTCHLNVNRGFKHLKMFTVDRHVDF